MQPHSVDAEVRRHLRHNFTINLLDGSFFGFALGFGSFVTVIPLFVRNLTASALLIGLVPAIHNVGWQLPQLFTAGWVSRMRRFKPAVIAMTVHERLPFLGLATIAWFLPRLETSTALTLTFLMLVWQGLGGGFTANAWTSMISKVMPADVRGTFFGLQSAAANGFAALSAVAAGYLLEHVPPPANFALCFLLTAVFMGVSLAFLAGTREPSSPAMQQAAPDQWQTAARILRTNRSFAWFLMVRTLSHFALMASAFYMVYAVERFHLSADRAGLLTGAYMASLILVNPLLGWLGDRWSHRLLMVMGLCSAALSALLAWWAPDPAWFYAVLLLLSPGVAVVWITALTMTTHFGTESERPVYIGLSNTLPAPAAILAPVLGGLLADHAGYSATFLATAAAGLVTALLLFLFVRDPRHERSVGT